MSQSRCFILTCVVALTLASQAGASGGRRVALIIGNSAYQHTAQLANPKNDASDFGGALTKLGFEIVLGADLDKSRMDRAIRQFAEKLNGAELGVFFYAGHGLQYDGQNYLVPVDAHSIPVLRSTSKWSASTLCNGRWSGQPKPMCCSSTPAATTRWQGTWHARSAPVRPASDADLPSLSRAKAR